MSEAVNASGVVGACVENVLAACRRLRPRPGVVRSPRITWPARALLAFAIYGSVLHPAPAQQQSLRDDALGLMGAGLMPNGLAGYCQKFVEPNPSLLSAVAQWNQRNNKFMEQAVKATQTSGGLTAADQAQLDGNAGQLIKLIIEGQKDRVAYCRSLVAVFANRTSDLDQNKETSPMLMRLQAAGTK